MAFSRKYYNMLGVFGVYLLNFSGTPRVYKLRQLINDYGGRQYYGFYRKYTNKHPNHPYYPVSNYDLTPPDSSAVTKELPIKDMWTIKRKGNLLYRSFKPNAINSGDVRDFLEESNMPEEASWFYVESIKVQTKEDGDNNQNYVKGQGHDDVTTAPIPIVQDLHATKRDKPYVKGLSCTPSEETFDTIVNGRTITKQKLEVKTQPTTDEWMVYFDVDSPNKNVGLMESLLIGNATTYSQPILDWFSSSDSQFTLPENMKARLGGRTMLPSNVVYRPPIEIDWSFIGRPLNTRNYLVYGNGLTNYNYLNSILERFDFTGIEDNRYILDSVVLSNLGLGTVRRDSFPLFNRYRYQLPSIIFPTSSNEEEDYNIMNQNYSSAYRKSRLLSLLFEAAGLVNPLTFTATFVRMMINVSDLYMDYIDEQARINDSQNNFEGFDMPFYYKKRLSYSNKLQPVLDSGQTQTITMPTRKIEFMENGEKTYETENRFIELPINKLFRSTDEFKEYMIEFGIVPWALPNRHVFIKMKPYMELPGFDKSYDIWARIGDNGILL